MIIKDNRLGPVIPVGDLPFGQYYIKDDVFGQNLYRRIDNARAYIVETGQPFELENLSETVIPVVCEVCITKSGFDPDLPQRKQQLP